MTPAENNARLLAKWGPDKVRVRAYPNGPAGLWWRWDSKGYTQHIDEAGLFNADFETQDEVVPVDPDTNALDALVALALRQRLTSRLRMAIDNFHEQAWFDRGLRLDLTEAGLAEEIRGSLVLTTLGQWLLKAGRP